MEFKGTKARGGKRTNAGRKPKAYTVFKKRIESERIEDADYAFWLHAQTMRDESQPIDLRLDCADWVANRVLGRVDTLKVEHSGELTAQVFTHDVITRLVTRRPSGDSSTPSANQSSHDGAAVG